MFTIEKTFTGDVAHRIHNQNLDSEFTENNSKVLKCRRLHGHTFELLVKVGSDELIDDMVVDYNELGFMKSLIDDLFDHHTLLSTTDPWFNKLIKPVYDSYTDGKLIPCKWSTDKYPVMLMNTNVEDSDIQEYFSSFVLVDFTSSSENISKWIFDIVKNKISVYNNNNGTNVKVVSVSYKETPKSCAVYSE